MDISNKRLREAREKAGQRLGFRTASEAARKFGWLGPNGSVSTYLSHEGGQTPVPKKAAKKYAKAFKVDEAWLLGMDNPKPADARDKNVLGLQPQMEFNDIAGIPEFDVFAGGAIYADKRQNTGMQSDFASNSIRASWGVPVPFLNDELHIRSGRAHMLLVRGDSMEDALFDGDRAIIDLDDTEINQAGIFALLDDVAKLIIVQVTPVHGSRGQRIMCTYANSRYPPFELPLEDPVKIVGRVAARITRF